MDIEHLKYFITVVHNEFNLSEAAKKLHISQPALSKYILKFEETENIDLFYRKHGRLVGLTASGENFLSNAQEVVEAHERMLKELREQSKMVRGVVRIGIPPLILTVLFSKFLAKLILLNPLVRFDIVEEGAFELKRLLALDELDFAVLLSPTDLHGQVFQEDVLQKDALTAFMSPNHPFKDKEKLQWTDLRHEHLAIFNESFMIHHQLQRKFQSLKMNPKIQLTSGSWDFLLEMTKTSDFITILPSPVRQFILSQNYIEKAFVQPLHWTVVLTYPVKGHRSTLEKYVRASILSFFKEGKEPVAISTWQKELGDNL